MRASAPIRGTVISTRTGQRVPGRPGRAIVAPDDSITFPDDSDDAFQLWIEEDGMFNDHGPRPKDLKIVVQSVWEKEFGL